MPKLVPPLAKLNSMSGRLRILRGLTGLSRKEFAKQFGISLDTLKYWETANTELTEKGAIRIINAVKTVGVICTTSWLLNGIGRSPQLMTINNGTAITPDDTKRFDINDDESEIAGELALFRQKYHDVLSLQMSDDSMMPIVLKYDYLAGVAMNITEAKQLINQACLVELHSGLTLCRILKAIRGEGKARLVSHNINSEANHLILENATVASISPINRLWRKC